LQSSQWPGGIVRAGRHKHVRNEGDQSNPGHASGEHFVWHVQCEREGRDSRASRQTTGYGHRRGRRNRGRTAQPASPVLKGNTATLVTSPRRILHLRSSRDFLWCTCFAGLATAGVARNCTFHDGGIPIGRDTGSVCVATFTTSALARGHHLAHSSTV